MTNPIDQDLLNKVMRALGSDATIIIKTPALHAYLVAAALGLAVKHPDVGEQLRNKAFDLARSIEQPICEATGVPPFYQLGEHASNDTERKALLDKHLGNRKAVDIKLLSVQAFNVVGLLQLAIRHPDCPARTAQICVQFGRHLQAVLSQAVKSQLVYDVLEKGWNEENNTIHN